MPNRFGLTPEAPEPPPRIIRRVRFVSRSHGGAWKVAFADLVTAMMALFLVLWLASAADQTRLGVALYFEDPTGYSIRQDVGSARGGDQAPTRNDLEDLARDIREAMRAMPELGQLEQYVEISVSGEGLRIELLETEKGVFFNLAQPGPTEIGREALLAIATQLTKLNNNLAIEGHTDARPFDNRRGDYSNWELSTDRANAARRILVAGGVDPTRISQVRGFAAGRLRKGDPEDPSNRRVSLIALYDE